MAVNYHGKKFYNIGVHYCMVKIAASKSFIFHAQDQLQTLCNDGKNCRKASTAPSRNGRYVVFKSICSTNCEIFSFNDLTILTEFYKTFLWILPLWVMEQRALKNVNNYLNTSIYSYLETSGG